ncbi:hypothetical protein D3C80_1979400 [compost metagenome]
MDMCGVRQPVGVSDACADTGAQLASVLMRAGASRWRGAEVCQSNRCWVAAPQMRPWQAPMPQRV